MHEKLEAIAAALRALHPDLTYVQVSLGVGQAAALDVLATVGARRYCSFYDGGATVIESREIAVGGVTFRAQADQRATTDEERATEDARQAAIREAEDLEKRAQRLRQSVAGSSEERAA